MFDRVGRIESESPFVVQWFVEYGVEVWSVNKGQQMRDEEEVGLACHS